MVYEWLESSWVDAQLTLDHQRLSLGEHADSNVPLVGCFNVNTNTVQSVHAQIMEQVLLSSQNQVTNGCPLSVVKKWL